MLKSDPRSRVGADKVNELEDKIEKLKLQYEMFFSGIDNIDPGDKRIQIRTLITRLNELHIKNPAVRFRFQSLVGRFVSMNQYWTRIMREIEEGRLQRGLFRSRTLAPGEKPKSYYGDEAPDIEKIREDRRGAMEAVAYKPVVKEKMKRHDIRLREISEEDLADSSKMRHQRPLAGPSEGTEDEKPVTALDDKKIDRICDEYIEARREYLGNSTNIKKETIANQLGKQAEALRRKYNTEDITFRVIKKDGKVSLKPVVRKSKG